jgi:hypothetical protein
MNMSHEQTGAMGPEAPQAPGTPPPAPPLVNPAGFVAPGAGPQMPPQAWSARPVRDPRCKSPVLAGVLSGLIPGLGHVYLGYTQRGFVHALIFAGVIAMLSSGNARHMEPLFGIFLGFFWFYNIIDAVRRAHFINHALAGMGPVELPRDMQMPSIGGSIFGGVLITFVGLVFLLRTRFDVDLDWLVDWWPAFIVAFGLYLIYKSMRGRK